MKHILYLFPLLLTLLSVETVEAKKVKYPNGDYYVGKWKKKTPHGEGTMKYANGDVYVGLWEYGEKNGKGMMTYKNNSIYEGDWLSGDKYGKGKMTYSDGSIYEGDWVLNKRHGQGKHTRGDGDVYEGGFVDDLYHGEGIYTCYDGTVYDGTFYKGLKQGKGIQKGPREDWYEGTWNRGRFSSGRCYYKKYDGTTFLGNYADGQIQSGKMTFSNGDCYEGEYKNGQYYKGEFTFANGDWCKGEFKDGKFFSGECKQTDSKRTYEGSYKNGVPYTGITDGYWGENYYKGEIFEGIFIKGECELKTSDYFFKGQRTEDVFWGTMEYRNGFVYEGALNLDLKKTGEGTLIGNSFSGKVQGEFYSDSIVKGKGSFVVSSKEYTFAIEAINEEDYNVKIYDNDELFLNDNMPIFETDSVFEKMSIALEEKLERERQEKIMAESRAFCKKHFAGHVYKANSVSWNSSAEGAWLMGTIMDIKVTLRFVSSDKAEYTVHAQMTNALDDNPYVRMQLESVCNEMDGMTETVEYKYVDGKLYIDNVECSTGNNFKNIQFDMGMWNCWLKQVK